MTSQMTSHVKERDDIKTYVTCLYIILILLPFTQRQRMQKYKSTIFSPKDSTTNTQEI